VLASTAASYLETLNPEQRRAVEHGVCGNSHVGLPLLVIAGALKRRHDRDVAERRVVAGAHRENAERSNELAEQARAEAEEKARLAEQARREADASAAQAEQQESVATSSLRQADEIDPDTDSNA